ncbi:nuclear receptor 2C2-associated protein-like [Homarus americanus]|uniref:nuclear receptor 2C2-associated protein-like n=1 Tax=Homarus americanus TaxID=6706 RepID=UPI001C45A23F|nr:nuclear receptor 2C2-associated protein-like [Homarus americanus]XP_042239064.1 nuclear receptor 2C2-associated protein-like [Homarus americanus]
MMAEVSLVTNCDCRVSSVLGKNTRELGKQYLFDGSPETCWNSDQGTPQWVALRWKEPVIVTSIIAQFQGGFCGSPDTVVEVGQEGSNCWEEVAPWHLEDVGTEQIIRLQQPRALSSLRLTFKSSTDFHGRIIMYKLDVLGNKL